MLDGKPNFFSLTASIPRLRFLEINPIENIAARPDDLGRFLFSWLFYAIHDDQ